MSMKIFRAAPAAARRLLPAVTLLLVSLQLAGCAPGARERPDGPDGAGRAEAAAQESERPPIDLAVLREDVERHAEWTPFRKARCPRQLPDLHEELRRYPAISILKGLGYITITDGTARGIYVKNMELTEAGRRGLGDHVESDFDRYVITIASREYLPGAESFKILPNPERLVANFEWRWKPLNVLGERLTLGTPPGLRGGFATYTRSASGWSLDKVYLTGVDIDYMWGV